MEQPTHLTEEKAIAAFPSDIYHSPGKTHG